MRGATGGISTRFSCFGSFLTGSLKSLSASSSLVLTFLPMVPFLFGLVIVPPLFVLLQKDSASYRLVRAKAHVLRHGDIAIAADPAMRAAVIAHRGARRVI